MRIHLASCAELIAEHRRTASPRKREKIAAELQRRHDEWMKRPGFSEKFSWWSAFRKIERGRDGILRPKTKWERIMRFDFALWLP